MRELIKKILKEELGVPKGILESSELLYELILKRLKRVPLDSKEENEISLKTDFSILDLNIKKVNIILSFIKTAEVDKVQFYSMAFRSRYELGKDKIVLINIMDPNTINLIINFAGPLDSTKNDVYDYFVSDKNKITSSLSHELGHAYNQYKKGVTSIKTQASYAGYANTSFPFEPVNKFIHYLYFIHSFENIVRPIEVSSLIRSDKITKKMFYDFITNNETYQMLKEINNFSYDDFRKKLLEDSENIKKFLMKIGVKAKDLKNKNSIVNELLRVVYINISNNSIENAADMLVDSPLDRFLGIGLRGDRKEFFKSMANYFTKFQDDPIKFYKIEEKNFKSISEKMIKKISKLYAAAEEDTENDSINNWDLHHKINKTGENIVTEFKFNRMI